MTAKQIADLIRGSLEVSLKQMEIRRLHAEPAEDDGGTPLLSATDEVEKWINSALENALLGNAFEKNAV